MAVDEALRALVQGTPVMVYDGDDREAEVDLVYHASRVDADAVYTLRTRAGGLICYATTSRVTGDLGIPWGDELIASRPPLDRLAAKRLSYGDRPAFTIWVNHVGVRTGISDEDRGTTIRGLDRVVETYFSRGRDAALQLFLEEFQAPGHVPILASRGLAARRGHTELSIALALLAGLRPSVAFAEMLDYRVSLPLSKARRISRETGWPLVSGDEIVEACKGREVCWRG